MIFKTIVASLLLSTFVLAQKKPNLGGKPAISLIGPLAPPPFLKNVTEEGKKAFSAIVKNQNLTIAATKKELGEWAKKYKVSEQYNAFEAKIVAHWAAVRKNRTEVIGKLASVQKQIEAIFDNKGLTRKAQLEALEKLRQKNPKEVEVLSFITRDAKPPGVLGGPAGPGGPRGPKRPVKRQVAQRKQAHKQPKLRRSTNKPETEGRKPHGGHKGKTNSDKKAEGEQK